MNSEKSYSQNSYLEFFSLLKRNKFPLFVFLLLFLNLLFLFILHFYFFEKKQYLKNIISSQSLELKELQQKDFIQKKFERDKLNKKPTFIKFYKSQFFKFHDSSLVNKKVKQLQKKHKIKKIVMKISVLPEKLGEFILHKHHVDLSFQRHSIKDCLSFLKDIEHKIPGIVKVEKYQIKKQLIQKKKKRTLSYNVKVSFDWLVLKAKVP